MRRLFLLSLLMLTTGFACAQQLTVKSFTADPLDISGSTQRRLAPSGKPCALIKVQMVDRLLKTEGDMNVGDMARRGATTWLYLPDGTYGVSLVTEQHGTVDVNFADHGIGSVQSLCTYLLTIAEATPADPDHPTDAKAQYELALDYKMPRNGKQRDEEKSMEWFLKAAEQGLAEAQLEVGRHYVKRIDDANRVNMWNFIATGDASTPYRAEAEDSTAAISWLTKAAEQGLADAQYELGDLYFDLWVHIDMPNGHPFIIMYHHWNLKAAEQGHIQAMENEGKYYEDIIYWPLEIKQRMKWNERASNKGSAVAAYNQGLFYEYYYKNRKKAKEWYQKASRRGHKEARDKLDQVIFENVE